MTRVASPEIKLTSAIPAGDGRKQGKLFGLISDNGDRSVPPISADIHINGFKSSPYGWACEQAFFRKLSHDYQPLCVEEECQLRSSFETVVARIHQELMATDRRQESAEWVYQNAAYFLEEGDEGFTVRKIGDSNLALMAEYIDKMYGPLRKKTFTRRYEDLPALDVNMPNILNSDVRFWVEGLLAVARIVLEEPPRFYHSDYQIISDQKVGHDGEENQLDGIIIPAGVKIKESSFSLTDYLQNGGTYSLIDCKFQSRVGPLTTIQREHEVLPRSEYIKIAAHKVAAIANYFAEKGWAPPPLPKEIIFLHHSGSVDSQVARMRVEGNEELLRIWLSQLQASITKDKRGKERLKVFSIEDFGCLPTGEDPKTIKSLRRGSGMVREPLIEHMSSMIDDMNLSRSYIQHQFDRTVRERKKEHKALTSKKVKRSRQRALVEL